MNDDVSEKAILLAVKVTSLTGSFLVRGLKKFVHYCADTEGKGKQSVKQLVKQGQGASSVEVSGESMRKFKRIARKYGVDFAIVKNKDSDPLRYTVFFKAKDMDAITAVVKEYSAKVVKMKDAEKKPSIVAQLHELKAKISRMPQKVKEKIRENVR